MTKRYTIYNENSFKVLETIYLDENLPQPANSTELPCEISAVSLCFNPVTNEFYEGASQELIQSYFIENAPKTVSRRQLRLALSLSGFDLGIIDNVMNSLEGQQKTIALIAWNDSITFERNDSLLISLANSVGFDEYQLAQLFTQASQL